MNVDVRYIAKAVSAFVLVVCFSNSSYAADFATRCSQPGVVKCVGFDDPQDIVGGWGDNHGALTRTADSPAIDTAVTASGSGALKFTAHGSSSSMGGDYFTNFSEDLSVQFGPGEPFYVQFRQRFSSAFLDTTFTPYTSWKQMIVGAGDRPNCETVGGAVNQCGTSCSPIEVVLTNSTQGGFPIVYRSCDGSTHLAKGDPLVENFGSSDIKFQNARPSPYCLYSQWMSSYFPPVGNCFGYFANEWMTFQIMVEPGPRVNDEFVDSKVKLWIAREGQPSELVMDFSGVYLAAGNEGTLEYGKVFLIPYLTGKSSGQAHPTAYTWYDELIISSSKIDDPDGSGVVQKQSKPPADLAQLPGT